MFAGYHYSLSEAKSSQFWLPLGSGGDLGEIKVAVAIVDNAQKPIPFTAKQKDSMVGYLELDIIKATHLRAADTFSSDPFCVASVDTQRRRTKTILKSLNPVWSAGQENVMQFKINDVRRLCPPIFRRLKPHLLFYEGVLVTRWVIPYKCRKIVPENVMQFKINDVRRLCPRYFAV